MVFSNIEQFYKDNHYKLIEDKSDGSLRPGKSFTKDVENCINKFSEYYKENNCDGISETQLVEIIGDVDTNTRSQNLRVMREFNFMFEVDNPTDDMKFSFTEVFKGFISSGESARDYIYNKLQSISSIDDLSMYLNLLLCTLREAYLFGQVILFKDSDDKFKTAVPDLDKRNYYRKRIFEVYGYSGRDKQITDDVYSPNLSYMSRAELENLGLLIKTTEKIDNMENLVLTVKGYELLKRIDSNLGAKTQQDGEQIMGDLKYYTGIETGTTRNQIIFGAPGTGKSFTLNQKRIELLGSGNEADYERVTFHPDYSYANFVGTYKPVMVKSTHEVCLDSDKKDILAILQDKSKTAQEKYDILYDTFKDEGLTRLPILLGLYTDENFKTKKQDGSDAVGDNSVERNHGRAIRPFVDLLSMSSEEKEIAYQYVPGPFMRVLVKALKSAMSESPKPYLLLIEEINRANVAAVFGDVFQLLDRAGNGVSEYEIATTNDMKAYLAEELGVDVSKVETIKIPDNMFIWATMNSADQGVFPMDTAFKRRWDFTYLGIDDAETDMSKAIAERTFIFGQGEYARQVKWNDVRRAINSELSSEAYNINEDKLLGPYFISKNVLEGAEEEFLKVFKNKVLMYLFDDAVKQKKKTFFERCMDEKKGVRYSEICAAFDKRGVFIFPDDISSQFTEKPSDNKETVAE